MAAIEDKTKNKTYDGQHYYAEFKNTADNLYYLVFDEKGVLVDSIIRNGMKDTHALTQLEKKYGALIKLSEISALKTLPIANYLLAEMKEASDKWTAEWSKTSPDAKVAVAAPKRFSLKTKGTLKMYGVLWGDGRVSVTWVQDNIDADWSKVGGPPVYLYQTFQEFKYMHPETAWEFAWIDDEVKSQAAARKIVEVAKEASALSKKASELVDSMSTGR